MDERIPIVIITTNRNPRKNYVFETLTNLKRGSVFDSKFFHSLTVYDDCSEPDYAEAIRLYAKYNLNVPITVVRADEVGGSKGNAERAHRLLFSLRDDCKWGMVMEDDIDVCANFLQSAVKWLREVEHEHRHLYFMALPDAPKTSKKNLFEMEKLWGSQCYVVRTEDSVSIANFLHNAGPKNNGHDTKLLRWLNETYSGEEYKPACCPVPTFIQHIGVDSSIQGVAKGITREKAKPIFNFIGRDKSYA